MKTEELKIKASDLRLGNWVMYDNRYFQVSIIAECFPELNTYEFGIGVVDYNNISAIPLSEEVLLKCGATLDGIEYIIKASALPIKIRFHSGIAYCEFGNVYLGDRVKYLHELQNLVFALCGREMEVSL